MGRKATPEEIAILEGRSTQGGITADQNDPAGMLESFGLGTARGTGRLLAGGQRISTFASLDPFSEKARQEREDITSKEAAKEADFQLRTQEHPVAAFLGEALPPTVLSGGRSPAAAFTRGAGTGALSFNPSPAGTALQTALGGVLGGGAQRLVQGQRLGPEAREMGLRVLPEQTSPTLLRAPGMEGLSAFKKQALKTARFNQKQVTSSALRDDLASPSDRFVFPSPKTKGTLQDAEERASKLFKDALGTKENIIILKPRMRVIDEIANSQRVPTDSRDVAIGFAKRIRSVIAKNKGVFPASEYQAIRSDLTTSMRSLSSGGKVHALGEMLDILDDSAQGSLSTDSLKKFAEARRLWKNKVKYELLEKRGGIDTQTGLIDPKKFDTLLKGKDAPAYIFNKNPSRTTQMMQLNRQISGALDVKGSGQPRGGLTRVRFSQSGPSFMLDRFLGGPIGGVGLKANRLPTDLLTDIPPGVMPPLLNMTFGESARNPLLGEQ